MENPDRIHLRDYITEAEIGAFQSERGHQQRLRFAVTADLAQPVSDAGDQVDAILSYDVLSGAIASALAAQRYNLVETLAERIAAEVLAHPGAARVEVTVEKLDRGPFALGVTIRRRQGRVQSETARLETGLLLYGMKAALPEGPLVIVPAAPGLPVPPGGDQRRIALLALDQAAWALAGQLELPVVASRTELTHAIATAQQVIWAPALLAQDAPDVNSDPTALLFWLAGLLPVRQITMALPPDTPLPISPPDLSIPVMRLS